MFDANMRHMPKGREFIAQFYYCEKGGYEWLKGAREGDVALCEMLDEGHENPYVKFTLENGESFVISHLEGDLEGDSTWLVYSGNTDGTGFLDNEQHVRAKAYKLLLNLERHNLFKL